METLVHDHRPTHAGEQVDLTAVAERLLVGTRHEVTFLVPRYTPGALEFAPELAELVLRRGGRLRLVLQDDVAERGSGEHAAAQRLVRQRPVLGEGQRRTELRQRDWRLVVGEATGDRPRGRDRRFGRGGGRADEKAESQGCRTNKSHRGPRRIRAKLQLCRGKINKPLSIHSAVARRNAAHGNSI